MRITREDAERFARELLAEERSGRVAALWVGLMTGLRLGEALALSWRDVDLAAPALRVRHQWGKEHRLKAPKTRGSRRTVPLDPAMAAWLAAWKGEQDAAKVGGLLGISSRDQPLPC